MVFDYFLPAGQNCPNCLHLIFGSHRTKSSAFISAKFNLPIHLTLLTKYNISSSIGSVKPHFFDSHSQTVRKSKIGIY